MKLNENELHESNFFKTFTVLGKLLLVNSLFLIFNNSQLSIILAFVNKKYHKDEILTGSIGIVNTIMNVLVYPFIIGIASTLEILGSRYYGAKKYKYFSYILSNLRLIGNCFILISCCFIFFFNRRIFHVWNVDFLIQNEAEKVFLIRLISVFFEFEIYIKLRYLQIINKSSDSLIIIASNGFLLPFWGYIFITTLNFYSYGCGMVYLFNNFFMLISILVYINTKNLEEKKLLESNSNLHFQTINEGFNNDEAEHIVNINGMNDNTNLNNKEIIYNYNTFEDKEFNKDEKNQLEIKKTSENTLERKFQNQSLNDICSLKEENKNNKDINENPKSVKEEVGYCALFEIIIPLFLISFMDNLSVESMSIFANSFDPKSYSEFLNAYSLYGLVGTISVSFNTSSSIVISSNFGIFSGNILRKLIYNILAIGFIISCFIGSFLFLFSDYILEILLQTKDYGKYTESMFHISILCNMIDIIQYIFLSALKSFGFIYLGFSVYFVGNLMNFLMIYFFAFSTDMKIYGIFFGYLINELITITMYIFTFFFWVDFKKLGNGKSISQ